MKTPLFLSLDMWLQVIEISIVFVTVEIVNINKLNYFGVILKVVTMYYIPTHDEIAIFFFNLKLYKSATKQNFSF